MSLVKPAPSRLVSLDALRGFDMFWIIGGAAIFKALSDITGWGFLEICVDQMEHAEWNGFHFYDLIFPMFLFISGVTMPYSLIRSLEQGESKSNLYKHVIRRGLLLVLLGLVYNGVLGSDFSTQEGRDHVRYASVLARIGLAYVFAAFIVINFKPRAQIFWGIGILLAYWAMMMLIPVPGFGAGVLTPEGSLVGYIDRQFLPGRLYLSVHDPEGILGIIPAIVTALMGALAGDFLRNSTKSGSQKAAWLFAAGVASILIGYLWGMVFPVNKNLWSSSFVLVAGGWSLVLLSTFYQIIDVWGWKKWTFLFVVIGVNPITIYLLQNIVDFQKAAKYFVGGIMHSLSEPWAMLVFAIGIVALKVLLLYFLHRQKIYLKV